MQSSAAISAALVVAVPVGLALIIGIIVLAGRARPRPGLGTLGPSTTLNASGVWNGEVLGDGVLGATGGTLGSTFGTMRIDAGALSFTPDGATTPAWSAPCATVCGRRRTMLALNGADMELWGQSWRLRCNVSREHINRFSRNDIKSMRQRRYANEFLRALASNGARIGA